MDTLSKGTVRMDGRDISHFNRTQLENYRRYDIGFVFQFYNLIPNLTALENVEIADSCAPMPSLPKTCSAPSVSMTACRTSCTASGRRAAACFHCPRTCQKPKLLLCDEPTGAPDYETGKSIFKAFRRIPAAATADRRHHAQCGACRAMADRIIRVKSGHIYSVRMNEHITPVEQIEW